MIKCVIFAKYQVLALLFGRSLAVPGVFQVAVHSWKREKLLLKEHVSR